MPLQVSIVTPERVVWEAEAEFILARSEDGDLGILPGHAPFLGALGYARLIVQGADEEKFVAVDGGFIEVLDNRVTVLTGSAELAEEIDLELARREVAQSEAALREQETEERRLRLMKAKGRVQTAAEAGLLDIG